MEPQKILEKQNQILRYLSTLPSKIISMQQYDNVTEFVLHDLCHEQCFGLRRAAYLVDNPDFDWVKGVAGFSRDEAFANCDALWSDPQSFSQHMQSSQFNQKVRTITQTSPRRCNADEKELVTHLANELGLKNYGYCSWNMKHDNHGLVIYEKQDASDTTADDYLYNGMMLLSFCPVF